MKSKIISFVVVFVFVMSMFPANVFAAISITCGGVTINAGGSYNGYTGDSNSGYYDSNGNPVSAATVCGGGGTGGTGSGGTGSGSTSSSSSSEEEDNSGPVLGGLLLVGLIVWAVWPKKKRVSSENFEITDDGTYAVAATNNNWSWKVSYGYEEEKEYSLGVSYSFK